MAKKVLDAHIKHNTAYVALIGMKSTGQIDAASGPKKDSIP